MAVRFVLHVARVSTNVVGVQRLACGPDAPAKYKYTSVYNSLLVYSIHRGITNALNVGQTIQFQWVSGHFGIPREAEADKLAVSSQQ